MPTDWYSKLIRARPETTVTVSKVDSTYYADHTDGTLVDSGSNLSTIFAAIHTALPATGGKINLKGPGFSFPSTFTITKNLIIDTDQVPDYYNPTLTYTGTGNAFTVTHSALQNSTYLGIPNMYLDMGFNGADGIALTNLSRLDFGFLGIKRAGAQGLHASGIYHLIRGKSLDLIDCDGSGLCADGTLQTQFSIDDCHAIGCGNDTSPTQFCVDLGPWGGRFGNLYASGGGASVGGRSDKGFRLSPGIFKAHIDTLHLETVGPTNAMVIGTSVSQVAAVNACSFGDVFVYDYTGTTSPLLIGSATAGMMNTFHDGGGTPNYTYSVEAVYNASWPNNVKKFTIVALDSQRPILDLHNNLTIGSPKTNTATFSGTGAQTVFNIAHGQSPHTPRFPEFFPTSAAACGDRYVTADATNIIITYTTAPASGSSNITGWWRAGI